MKVILMQELKGRGGEGDVIEVARGFAVNYLLPRKIAIEATQGNVKQLELRRHNIQKREDARMSDASGLAANLDGKTVTIAAKVGEEGRLFGSVTAPMVHEAILDQLGVDVDRRKIETHGHIKDIGPHVIDISVYREIKVQVTVDVVAEGAAPVVAPAPAAAAQVTENVAEEDAEAVEAEEIGDEVEPSDDEPAEAVEEDAAE
jgi:large subunit ribosomal protein L9